MIKAPAFILYSRSVLKLTASFSSFAGVARANIHGGILGRNVYQDFGPRIHFTQKQLHAKFLEHHGLLCCFLGVRKHFFRLIVHRINYVLLFNIVITTSACLQEH